MPSCLSAASKYRVPQFSKTFLFASNYFSRQVRSPLHTQPRHPLQHHIKRNQPTPNIPANVRAKLRNHNVPPRLGYHLALPWQRHAVESLFHKWKHGNISRHPGNHLTPAQCAIVIGSICSELEAHVQLIRSTCRVLICDTRVHRATLHVSCTRLIDGRAARNRDY